MKIKRQSYSRIGVSHSAFADIAMDNYIIAKKIHKKNQEQEANDDSGCLAGRPTPSEERVANFCDVAICFSAMALESFIYDYSASHLGDNYTDNYIGKLDLLSKWIVVPRLITEEELETDGKAYFLLKNLIRQRNSLVHSKSKDYSNADKLVLRSKFDDYDKKMIKMARQGLETVYEISKWLNSVDDEIHAFFQFNISSMYPEANKWKEIVPKNQWKEIDGSKPH